ncbi:hypothetical protein EUZ85_22085 [Hahella sp. KA22]|uniref:hypothetical protein n=1 Tax=unclassified Hahella TaxID=2624107 RepID=UPI000FDDAEA3|nr:MULTISPECIES: hypothetical protein [unclassified Hahella]AZZ93268.1 hypothetical protein ENC22_19505 [Hahella sp. KA22]QAY56642.1 hypothetical protein EUZ85_22085 [Hahella sp. KA22]WLQ17237.1 hypothetical protein O5O45_15050 [Hahella sp. HNIBRBA332]
MTTFTDLLKAMVIAAPLAFSLTACDAGDGEAEQIGEEVDRALNDAGNRLEDACESVKEGVNARDQDC